MLFNNLISNLSTLYAVKLADIINTAFKFIGPVMGVVVIISIIAIVRKSARRSKNSSFKSFDIFNEESEFVKAVFGPFDLMRLKEYQIPFEIDGVSCSSLGSFLLSLRYEDENDRRRVANTRLSTAIEEAKANGRLSVTDLYWKDMTFEFRSEEYLNLVYRASSIVNALQKQSSAKIEPLDF